MAQDNLAEFKTAMNSELSKPNEPTKQKMAQDNLAEFKSAMNSELSKPNEGTKKTPR